MRARHRPAHEPCPRVTETPRSRAAGWWPSLATRSALDLGGAADTLRAANPDARRQRLALRPGVGNYTVLSRTHIPPDLGARKLRDLTANDIDR